jgi:glycosyltransferase involved in cell wall biosynthesis
VDEKDLHGHNQGRTLSRPDLNLLVIHEVNYSAKIIYEFQILPEILTILGHTVTIIDYDDSWQATTGQPAVRFGTRVLKGTHKAYPEASVTVRTPGMIRLPVVSRISGAIASSVDIVRVMRSGKFDAVLLYAIPTVGLQALWAARAFRIPIFFRSIDILNRLVPFPVLRPLTRKLESFIYRRVDAISCVTPHLKDYVESYGVPPSRVEVLPSGVDTRLFSPGPREEALLAQWGIGPGDPVIFFMGTLYSFSGLDRVIREFGTVLEKHPRARLLVAGVGEDRERLEKLASEPGVREHVIFTGLQSYAALPALIRSSDLCINPFELNAITRDILPTKLFQYLACGKPVLMTELPGTLPFLKGPEDGVVYAATDLLSDRARLDVLGKNALRVAQRDFDWEGIARRLLDWIKRGTN